MNDTWILEYGNQLYGPYTTFQIGQMLQTNQISGQTLLRSSSTGGYFKAQDVVMGNAGFPNPNSPQMMQSGVAPQMGQPNMAPQMMQPGMVAPQMVQPGMVAPQMGQPNMAPQMMQPGMVAPQMVQPGMVAPQMGQPSMAPQMMQPGMVAPQMVQPGMVAPQPMQQEDPPPMVTPIDASKQAESIPESTVTLRDWIDRSNVENGKIVCPHCWGFCSLETILFVSSHPELVGDPLLGADAQKRFLPKYFTAKGTAFDEKGMECSEMACPHCHLKIPNAIIDLPSSFFSIVGAPASGKSYFLTSMIWQLRKALPKYFNFSLFDTDPSFNMVLNNYERILFLNPDQKDYVSLPKTELQGRDFSNQIMIENTNIDLPRPFVFTLSPSPTHPYYEKHKDELERSIVLYDNAGEHFETGRDSITNLATVHLVHSDGIIFLYDPLKDIRLRQDCSEDDPQISKNAANITNQITIFTEMVSRIHKYGNLKANEKYHKPLIMVIPKYDAWKEAFPIDLAKTDLIVYDQEVTPYLDMDTICAVSFCLRKYLLQIAPEIVGLAEGFSDRVYFVPVSALGRMPEFDEEKSLIGIKPDHLSPIWAEVPFLLQLHLNSLLQAVYLSNNSIPYVEHFQFNNGHISFVFPETKARFTLPSFYCGKTVYCDETKKYYRLPDYPKKQETVEEPENTDLPNQDFWTK